MVNSHNKLSFNANTVSNSIHWSNQYNLSSSKTQLTKNKKLRQCHSYRRTWWLMQIHTKTQHSGWSYCAQQQSRGASWFSCPLAMVYSRVFSHCGFNLLTFELMPVVQSWLLLPLFAHLESRQRLRWKVGEYLKAAVHNFHTNICSFFQEQVLKYIMGCRWQRCRADAYMFSFHS